MATRKAREMRIGERMDDGSLASFLMIGLRAYGSCRRTVPVPAAAHTSARPLSRAPLARSSNSARSVRSPAARYAPGPSFACSAKALELEPRQSTTPHPKPYGPWPRVRRAPAEDSLYY